MSTSATGRRPGKWPPTVAVMTGTFSVLLAATILNVALPSLMQTFAVDQQTAQWLITGFLAAMTAGMLTTAPCVERFGVRATFIAAMALFVAAAVAGAVGRDIYTIIAARTLQGVAAGVVQPLGMIVVFNAFPPEERGKGFGVYGLGVILAPAVAPLIGGYLVEFVSWRATFLAEIPMCVVAVILAATVLPSRPADAAPPRAFDIFGLILLAGALAALLWGLSNGAKRGWNGPETALWPAVGLIGLAAFAGWQRRARSPLLDPAVFASRGFRAGFAMTGLLGAGLYGSTFLIPLQLQQVAGLSPSAAGLALAPAGIAMALTFPLAGRLADRTSLKAPIIGGVLAFVAACAFTAFATPATPVVWLTAWAVLGRVGIGLAMPPISAGSLQTAAHDAGPQATAQGAGAVNFARQLGGALGVAGASLAQQWGAGGRLEPAAAALGHSIAFAALALVFLGILLPLHRLRP